MCTFFGAFVFLQVGVFGFGLWLVIEYSLYISEYEDTDYVASSCLFTSIQRSGQKLTVMYGNQWEKSTTLHQVYMSSWPLGRIESCYININNINNSDNDKRWTNVLFFSPNGLLLLYYFIVIVSPIAIIIPSVCAVIFVCNKNLKFGYIRASTSSDTSSSTHSYRRNEKYDMPEDYWTLSLVHFGLLLGIGAIGGMIFGLALAEYKRAHNAYNIDNYNDVILTINSTSNNTNISISDYNYSNSVDMDDMNMILSDDDHDDDINYYLCNITNIIDWKFKQKVLRSPRNNNDKKKITFLWLLYNVTVFKYINIDNYFDYNNSLYNNSTSYDYDYDYDSIVPIPGFIDSYMTPLKNRYGNDRAMQSFRELTNKYNKRNVSNFTQYFDVKQIGDIDWCYKSVKLNNNYQFNQPRYEYVTKTNRQYGTELFWLSLVGTVLFFVPSMMFLLGALVVFVCD